VTDNHEQFELLEDEAVTTSGFELTVGLAEHSESEDGPIILTTGCATFGEFSSEIDRLIAGLEKVRTEGETRFADGDFGPKPIFD
jgi:hypothetical protein